MKTLNEQGGWLKTLQRIHDDEDGLETLQIVMIVGVSVLILLVVVAFWKDIRQWATRTFSKGKSELREIE